MSIKPIPRLEDLLENVLRKKKVVDIEQYYLTAPGENYASLMLGLKIVLQDEDKNEEVADCVAKFLPDNEFMREFEAVKYTFRNELGFYQTILPTMRQHLKKDLDFFPKFFGGRKSIDSSELDDDAVILLENLKSQNYVLWNKDVGFDQEATQMILKKMSELHACFIALRTNRKQIFEEKLMPFFEEFEVFKVGSKNFVTSDVIGDSIIKTIKKDQFCAQHVDRIKEVIKVSTENLIMPRNSPRFYDDVFATINHNDLWANNIMVKVENNKIVDLKFLDWQLYEYSSATKDILFFSCTSVQNEVFEEKFDHLIKYYHECLLENLKELNCATDQFTFDVFKEEMKRSVSQVTYFYILSTIFSLFPSENQIVEVSELSMDKFLAQIRDVSEICERKVCMMTRIFLKKGWL